MADQQFILATRDTGYRSTPAAVCELIDNALQAGADVVHVLLREDRRVSERTGKAARRIALGVVDNGSGMDAATVRRALQFGGSERFNDRSGPGRFGMGLPNSSVSQSRRVEVYSWRDAHDALFSYLDVREIAKGAMSEVPAPVTRALPEWVSSTLKAQRHALPSTGTLVYWPECDRLPFRKASTLQAKLQHSLGRTYRYALRAGTQIFVDGCPVEAIDPLMEWGRIATTHGAATPYGEDLLYEFKALTVPSRTSVVRVRFTILPVLQWARLPLELRRELGIIGGAGVSVVRAGREVDYGWHLMGAKRRENYDDWWRCELRFEPDLDEYFGVTHCKQGITPHPALQDTIAADLEQIARKLNARVRGEFLHVAASRSAPSGNAQPLLPTPKTVVARQPIKIARERERFLPPPPHQRIRGFRIANSPLSSPRFFVVTLERGELVVTLNSEHPLYTAIGSADAKARQFFDTIILAAARAEVIARPHACTATRTNGDARGAPDALETYLEAWSDALAAYLSRRP